MFSLCGHVAVQRQWLVLDAKDCLVVCPILAFDLMSLCQRSRITTDVEHNPQHYHLVRIL